jgi:hypothetical protein
VVSATDYTNDTATLTATGADINTWRSIRTTNAPAKTSGKWHFEVTVAAYDGEGGWATGIANGSEIL